MKRFIGFKRRSKTGGPPLESYDFIERDKLQRRRKIYIRLAVALILFLILLGFSFIESPYVAKVKEVSAYYLVDEKSDLSSSIAEAVKRGIWMDPFEKGVLKTFLNNKGGELDSFDRRELIIPVSGKIQREFGWETSPEGDRLLHPGIDILAEKPGAEIKAALGGKVNTVGENQRLGKYVEIDCGGDLVTIYGNCWEITVKEGQQVKQGEIIAKLAPHSGAYLHFEVRRAGNIVNPIDGFMGADKEI
ncbi:MAG: M23 family metallopeptidase [Clostridia bacterium]|nr:M23 family metallopeptidase [Clostridia bacterium]